MGYVFDIRIMLKPSVQQQDSNHAYIDDESAELVLLQGDDLMVARLLSEPKNSAAGRQP